MHLKNKMPRRTWDPDGLQLPGTPVHARHNYVASQPQIQEDRSDSRSKAVQYALCIAVVYMVLVIVLLYSTDIFVPLFVIGTLGVFTLAWVIFRDMGY